MSDLEYTIIFKEEIIYKTTVTANDRFQAQQKFFHEHLDNDYNLIAVNKSDIQVILSDNNPIQTTPCKK